MRRLLHRFGIHTFTFHFATRFTPYNMPWRDIPHGQFTPIRKCLYCPVRRIEWRHVD